MISIPLEGTGWGVEAGDRFAAHRLSTISVSIASLVIVRWSGVSLKSTV